MERISSLSNQLSANKTSAGVESVSQKTPDDVVIVAAYRTAHAKGGKGGFKDTSSAKILGLLFQGLLERTNIDPKLIEDVVVGNVLNAGAGATDHRAAALAAGIPYTAPFQAVNRQCSSGLMAINDIANKISVGQIEIGLAAGVESMTNHYGPNSVTPFDDYLNENSESTKCLIPMGITNENIAAKYSISRRQQDEFAAASYQKAVKAIAEGRFKDEIIPLKVKWTDKDGNEKEIVVANDEGARPNTTVESLSKLRPAFSKTGTTHAGNASQISDGAGAVLLAKRSTAEKLGLPIVAKYIETTIVGVPPELMGVGPAYAIPKLLNKVGISKDDVDVYEINEAFSAQCLFSIEHVGIDINKVNPNGGAIAIGHPLGATGARQYATLINELKKTNKKIGVTSMCIGTGMGAASLIVLE